MPIGSARGAANSSAFHASGIVERRRSARRRLREPSRVTVQRVGSGTGWRCSGSLLNLSVDGVAVRLSAADVPEPLTVGAMVQVAFPVGDSAAEFGRTCRIANVTEGATPEQRVVGLEFIMDARSLPDRERLQAAISKAAGTDG